MTRTQRNVALFILSAVSLVTFQLFDSANSTVGKWSISSAYLSLAFFTAALLVGPLNLLRKKHNPTSNYLRRDFGIWSAFFAIVHTIAGLQIHFAGQFWNYFFRLPSDAGNFGLRYDAFGVTNYLGLISIIIIIVLLSISNDRAVRRLGISRWKRRQQSSYLLLLLLPLHGIMYQLLENRIGVYTFVLALCFIILLCLQLKGLIEYRKSRRTRFKSMEYRPNEGA